MRYELIRFIDKDSVVIPGFAFREIPKGGQVATRIINNKAVRDCETAAEAVHWFLENRPHDSLEWSGPTW